MGNASGNKNNWPSFPRFFVYLSGNVEVRKRVLGFSRPVNVDSVCLFNVFTMFNDKFVNLVECRVNGGFSFVFVQLFVGGSIEEMVVKDAFEIRLILQDAGPKVFIRGEDDKLFFITKLLKEVKMVSRDI